MKKLIKTLIFLVLPLGIHAQNDSAVSANMKRAFTELCSFQKYSRNQWAIGECISDNSEVGGESQYDMSEWQNMMLFKIGPCTTTFNDYWMRSYDIIARTNKIIVDVPGTSFSDDQKKLNIAEAKFVRSLAYFDLVTIFGGVPIYTDTFTWNITGSNSDYTGGFVFKARNSISEVFAQVESDLTDAITSLPNKAQLTSETIYYGTKGAARALLAKTYLYQSSYAKNYPGDSRFSGLTEQWGKALQYAEEVINSAEYSLVGYNGETYNTWWNNSYLYTTTPGFRYMFTKAGNDCSESVFEVRNLFRELGYLSYTANDISQFTTSRYMYKNTNKINTGIGWGFNVPTQDLINEFALESGNAKNDPRFRATIGVDGDSLVVQDSTWKKIYVSSSPTNAVCRKYEISPREMLSRNAIGYYTGESNIKIIRFADVLLMASEAALESGDNAKALTYINMVRKRARNSGNTGYPADLASVTFNDIVHERRLELALEGHRFFDLVRWNLAESKLNGRFNATFQTNVVFTKGVNEFFPISSPVMSYANGVVTQNNGYDQLCASMGYISDLFIKPGTVSNTIDLTGKYSSNTFAEPTLVITSSNPALAAISLANKKLNINYNNISDGDTTQVTLTMNYGNSQSLQTSFMIRVVQPLFTATDNQINKFYTNWMYCYEIKAFYDTYGLDAKNGVQFYTINFNNNMTYSSYIDYVNNDGKIGLSIGFSKLNFCNFVKKQNLKSDEIIPMLVILRNRILKKYYAIDVPVKVSDVVPFISLNRPQLAGNEISFKLSTTAINKEDTSIFSTLYRYRRSGFRFNVNYDMNSLEYLGYSFDSSIVSSLTHNVTVTNNEGSLVFSDTTKQPVLGEGELITLRFKDLGIGLGTLSANNFGFIDWYESDMTDNYQRGYINYPDNYNILLGNDVIEIGNNKKAAKLSVQIYPNPAESKISIDADFKNYRLLLYSMDGKLIKSENSTGSLLTVPVSTLARGMYFIKIIKDGEIQNLKFIKK